MHLPPLLPAPLPPLLARLPKDHLLRDLLEEHEALLAKLDRLDALINEYRDSVGTPEGRDVATRIETIADELLHAEPHHQREEQVLFPELEQRGITMPPLLMTREHEELRTCKRRLLAAASVANPDSETIAQWVGTLSPMLRDHIHKENEVLYPLALSAIRDAGTWDRMRAAARALGPCCKSCLCKEDSA